MAGANYMGGKRNAVRARTKDITSRLQKGHFGKQRLNLLAHGAIRNGAHSSKQNTKTASIDLAHARRDYSTPRPPPATSKNLVSHDSALFVQSPIPRSKPSKLLTVLEKLEPISFFSKKNRLLKITDFAGLLSKPAETTLAANKTIPVRFPGRKRKVDDSRDLFPRDVEKKRKLLPASKVIHGSSSSDLPPSPSPACPPRLSLPRSSSSIYSFQVPEGPSEISSSGQGSVAGRPNSTREGFIHSSHQGRWMEDEPTIPHCEDNLDQPCRDADISNGHVQTWEASISEVPTHSQSENFAVELLDMSEDWCEMADYILLHNFKRQQATEPQRIPRALGRLGVDFYVFPHLKPSSLGRTFETFTDTDSNLPDDPSDLSFPTLTPTRSDTPNPRGGPCPSAGLEVWGEHKCNGSPVDLHVPSPAASPVAPPLPIDICFASMEVLEYDTQPESQQLPMHLGQADAPKLPLDNALVSSSGSHTPLPSANTSPSNNKPYLIPGKPSHDIPTSQDHRKLVLDPLIDPENFNQSMDYYTTDETVKELSRDSLTGGSHPAAHSPMPELLCLAGNTNVDACVRPLEDPEDLQQDDIITELKSGTEFYSRNVETSVTGISSSNVNIDNESSIASAKSLHPKDVTTTGNHVQTPALEDWTKSEVTLRGQQTCLDHAQVDNAGPKGLIEGPLLFAIDSGEIED